MIWQRVPKEVYVGRETLELGLYDAVAHFNIGAVTVIRIGLFQKKSPPPRRMGFWKFSREGGSKTPEIQAGGGVDLKKVFCRGHFDR